MSSQKKQILNLRKVKQQRKYNALNYCHNYFYDEKLLRKDIERVFGTFNLLGVQVSAKQKKLGDHSICNGMDIVFGQTAANRLNTIHVSLL